MLKPRHLPISSRSLLPSQWLCPSCQSRLQRPYRLASSTTRPSEPPPSEPSQPTNEEFTPKPLSHPLGQPNPPKPGENSGLDTRTWRQRRDDFFNYDKHLERRKELTRKVSRPYFRDWTSAKHHRGKTFLSAPRLFKAESSLYFPNLCGYTLASPSASVSTTSVLQGRTSVVSVFSGTWAERQTQSFVGQAENAALAEEVERLKSRGGAEGVQRVWVNVEEDWMKAGLIWLFLGGMKRKLAQEEWGRSFVVRRGFGEEIRENIGMANGKVGYVYLVDAACRIRWAGSGDAWEGEGEGLVGCVKRLVEGGKREKEKGAMGRK